MIGPMLERKISLPEIHEFGNKNSPTILLLHAFGMHWSMWQGVIDGLKDDYHLLVPSLEGHEDKNRSVFTTVDHNAQLLSEWLCQNSYENIDAVVGVSLGGAITIKLLLMKTLHITYAIIDAGIVPVGFNRMQELREVCSNLFMTWMAAHSLTAMKLAGLYEQYGEDQMKKLHTMLKTISWRTAKNVFYGVDTYSIPDHLSDVSTKIAYWYGSLEGNERKPGAQRIARLFPNVIISCWDGYNHAQMCLKEPGFYVTQVKKFMTENKCNKS